MAQYSSVLCGSGFAQARLILAEGNVQAPMQVILHAPVTAHGVGKALGIGADAADVEAVLAARGTLARALALGGIGVRSCSIIRAPAKSRLRASTPCLKPLKKAEAGRCFFPHGPRQMDFRSQCGAFY